MEVAYICAVVAPKCVMEISHEESSSSCYGYYVEHVLFSSFLAVPAHGNSNVWNGI